MYFSLIAPKRGREREAARSWARGPYSEHQWLWKLFRAPEGQPRDFLYRRWDADGMPRFYVVSSRQPRNDSAPAWEIQTREYVPLIGEGTKLRFDLRANPTVVKGCDGRSKRHDVVMLEKKRLLGELGLSTWREWQNRPALYDLVRKTCISWLRLRESRLGFEVDEESLSVNGYQRHVEKNGDLRFSTVDFSGVLTVRDSIALRNALCSGIGRAKAFGCGLLLVRRA